MVETCDAVAGRRGDQQADATAVRAIRTGTPTRSGRNVGGILDPPDRRDDVAGRHAPAGVLEQAGGEHRCDEDLVLAPGLDAELVLGDRRTVGHEVGRERRHGLGRILVVDELDGDRATRRVAADQDGGVAVGGRDVTDAMLGCAHGRLS
jgi:hypothetical protein